MIRESPLKPLINYFLIIHRTLESAPRSKSQHEWTRALREINEVLIFLETNSTEKIGYYSTNYDAVKINNPITGQVLVELLGKKIISDINFVFGEMKEKNDSITSLFSDFLFEKDDPRRWNVVYEKTIVPGVYIASAEQPAEETGKKARYSYGILKLSGK